MTSEEAVDKQRVLDQLQRVYGDRFEVLNGPRPGQVNLFLIRHGLWSLVYTFIPKDFQDGTSSDMVADACRLIDSALNSRNPEFSQKLTTLYLKAKARIDARPNTM